MKKILVLNFFPAFVPPRSGGELRYYNVYKELSGYYDITLLSPTYNDAKEEVIEHSSTFREYRVPKEDIHNQLHWDINRENICSEISALVCCLSAKTHNRYHDVYQRLYPEADIIIHESPYMLYYDIYFGLDNKLRIYNSYNFETHLVEQMWSGPNAEKYLSIIRKAEETLVKECDLVFATSEEEREAFAHAYHVAQEKIHIAPNGIEVTQYKQMRENRESNDRKKAFFIGSAHPPNIEAVDFLVENVAPECPDIDFYIAGKCSSGRSGSASNVHFMGLVDEKQKDELFITSDVAVNPMFSGAGTNLKTLEFLSAGIPMVSTYVGVRGLGLEGNVQYVHAERDTFVKELKELLQNSEKMERLAQEGKRFVNAHYSWERICSNVHDSIERVLPNKSKRKPMILAINDYPVDTPCAGGEVRIHNLLRNMSKQYRVVYICLSEDTVKVTRINRDFIHICLPKTKEHITKEREINSKCWISANDIVAGNMIHGNELFLAVVKTLYALADIVILEHPYMVDSLKGLEGKPVIYESHNFEYKLKENLLEPHPMKNQLVAETKRLEHTAIEKAATVVCCSADEVPALKEFAGDNSVDFEVIRNGVEFTERKYDYNVLKSLFGGKPIALFVGSAHTPNVDAAEFIIRRLAVQVPECVFLVIGSVCDAFQNEPLAENVLLMGKLSNAHKDFLLFAADIALNPVDQGAGSNLKLAEYFAYGIPTVTTPFGARGYSVENGRHAIVCEREEFAEAVRMLMVHNAQRDDMINNAYQYARTELSWDRLADDYAAIIWRILKKKRLLVLTYRYNTPPRGGAETYLNNVLIEISKNKNYAIDIITTEIGDITDCFHYSCSYTQDKETAVLPGTGIRVRKFPVNELSKEEQWKKCHQIYQAIMQESVEVGRKFVDLYAYPLLMGGWHYPEVHEDGVRIWSSSTADIFVGNVDSIIFDGRIDQKRSVKVLLDGRSIWQGTVKHDFQITIDDMHGKVCSIEVESFSLKGQDPRPLGLYFNKIECHVCGTWKEVDFTCDYSQFIREKDVSGFIDSLIESACKRKPEIDDLFYETRGPRSVEMEAWLETHIENYDVVIGHGIPFDTLVIGQKAAKEHGVPYVALPHYHMEDKFYHWNLYYDALRQADYVIAAPMVSKELFYNKIGAHAVLVPGGGINPEEFEYSEDSLFQTQYPLDRPFVLVLGRKAGGKNYNWVIDAVEEINRRGTSVQLVMIGRDDDKIPVKAPNLLYLGEQSREMVLSALRNCAFVVNMSESESFGIVILEAWLSGKAVVVNRRCAAFAELVDDGINGVLTTHEDLTDTLEALLHDSRIETMAENGAQKAKRYSWGSIARQIEQICDCAIEGI